MSDNKKYYYIKLKDNYFEQDDIKILESMENGHIYSLILIKLYLKACKYNGQLKMNFEIPYSNDRKDIEILSKVINHDPAHVKEAVQFAVKFGLITICSIDQIFMTQIQNFIGHSSTEADRIREYRDRMKKDIVVTNVQQPYDISTPEIEIEIEIEKEIKKEIKRFIKPSIEDIYKYHEEKQFKYDPEHFYDWCLTNDWTLSNGNKMKDWKASMRTWQKNHDKFNPVVNKEDEIEERRKRVAEKIRIAEQNGKN